MVIAKTIFVDQAIWAQLKAEAALAGKTITDYLNEIFEGRKLVRARTR